MTSKRPTTIAEYIQAAPREGQPHLRRLYAILKSVAPEAEEAIKEVAAVYERETGIRPDVFDSTSPGAYAFGEVKYQIE